MYHIDRNNILRQRLLNDRSLRQIPGKSLSQLDKDCGWGCKLNSQGKPQYTKGYKLHLDVSVPLWPPVRFGVNAYAVKAVQLVLVVYTIHHDNAPDIFRIISARLATWQERRAYESGTWFSRND